MPFLINIIFISLQLLTSFAQQENWIDPHEIVISNTRSTASCSSNTDTCPICPTCSNNVDLVLTYYKRLMHLLLNAVVIDRRDSMSYNGNLYIVMSIDNYNHLKQFAGSSIEDTDALRKIDSILAEVLKKPPHEFLVNTLITWTDYIYFMCYNRTTGILLACGFVCFISYKLLRANLTLWSVFKYLIFLGWIIDFGFTWISLLEDHDIDKLADSLKYKSIPANCDPSQMSFWKSLWFSLSPDTACRDYHRVMYKDNFWKVAPITVISHQLGTVVVKPAAYFGEAVGLFSSALLSNLPIGLNFILFPLLLIFAAMMFCILLSFSFDTSFGFNILHIIQFHFGHRERHRDVRHLQDVNYREARNAIQQVAPPPVQNITRLNSGELVGERCLTCQNIQSSESTSQNTYNDLKKKQSSETISVSEKQNRGKTKNDHEESKNGDGKKDVENIGDFHNVKNTTIETTNSTIMKRENSSVGESGDDGQS